MNRNEDEAVKGELRFEFLKFLEDCESLSSSKDFHSLGVYNNILTRNIQLEKLRESDQEVKEILSEAPDFHPSIRVKETLGISNMGDLGFGQTQLPTQVDQSAERQKMVRNRGLSYLFPKRKSLSLILFDNLRVIFLD